MHGYRSNRHCQSLARLTSAIVVLSTVILGLSATPAFANHARHTPSGPRGYTYAATEGHHFKIKGIADVVYGVNGKFNRKTGLTGTVNCTNTVFGNPAKGVTKACFTLADVGPAGYTYAGTEGGHVNITGLADVVYGSQGKFNRKTGVTGGIDCNNTVFGDPDVGVHKSCYVLADTGPTGFSYAATENASFTITGVADVAYGANGLFNTKTGLTGHVNCNNSTFGDPDVHVHKSCYVKPH